MFCLDLMPPEEIDFSIFDNVDIVLLAAAISSSLDYCENNYEKT